MVQHSTSRLLPFKLVDEWANPCTTLPSWTLTPLASLLQSDTPEMATTRKGPRAPAAASGFKLATAKLSGGQGTDHFSKVSAPVGEYSVTFQSCHAGKVLTTVEPLRVSVIKSALPGSVQWMLPEEQEHQADHLPDITLSWPPLNQAGEHVTSSCTVQLSALAGNSSIRQRCPCVYVYNLDQSTIGSAI